MIAVIASAVSSHFEPRPLICRRSPSTKAGGACSPLQSAPPPSLALPKCRGQPHARSHTLDWLIAPPESRTGPSASPALPPRRCLRVPLGETEGLAAGSNSKLSLYAPASSPPTLSQSTMIRLAKTSHLVPVTTSFAGLWMGTYGGASGGEKPGGLPTCDLAGVYSSWSWPAMPPVQTGYRRHTPHQPLPRPGRGRGRNIILLLCRSCRREVQEAAD